MMYTTLNKIREHRPCQHGWEKLMKHLGKTKADDEPVSLETILDSNGLDDALWCTRTLPEYNEQWRLYAVWCVRQVQHLIQDERSLNALDVAEKHAKGEATDDELAASWAAADAARAAAWAATGATAWAASWDASDAARDAARDTARATAWAAADAAADAARAASWAASWAARAASEAARAAQEKRFREIILGK